MPTKTYKALANVTLGASASSVTFSNIPATYRDLVLVVGGLASAQANFQLQFNNDTGSNYNWVNAVAFSGGAVSANGANRTSTQNAVIIGSAQSTILVNFMDYSATDKHKTTLVTDTTDNNAAGAIATRWASLDPISTVSVASVGSTFSAGSTFSLYGRIA
jgi:hypothetical protein